MRSSPLIFNGAFKDLLNERRFGIRIRFSIEPVPFGQLSLQTGVIHRDSSMFPQIIAKGNSIGPKTTAERDEMKVMSPDLR